MHDDDPFIVLTETKFSIRYIPVWAPWIYSHEYINVYIYTQTIHAYEYIRVYIHMHVSSVCTCVCVFMCTYTYVCTQASIFLLVSEVRSSPMSSTLLKYSVTVALSSRRAFACISSRSERCCSVCFWREIASQGSIALHGLTLAQKNIG